MSDVTIRADARQSTVLASTSMSRRTLALLPPLAAVLLVLGQTLTPHGLDMPITSASRAVAELHIASMHSGRLYISNLLVIFGLGVLGAGFVAIATLGRDRDARLAATMAVAGAIGAFCGALVNMLIGYDVAAAATAASPTTARVLVAANTSTAGHVLIAGYLGGGLLAIMLSVIVLWRSPDVPRWLAPVFALGLIGAALSPSGLVAVPISLPFLLSCAFLAQRIRSETSARIDPARRP
jgi:hypothetical protein